MGSCLSAIWEATATHSIHRNMANVISDLWESSAHPSSSSRPGKTPWNISSGTRYPCAGNWIKSLRHLCLESMCGHLLVFWGSSVFHSWWRYGQYHQRSLGSDSVYPTVNTNLCRNTYVQTPRPQVGCRNKSVLNNLRYSKLQHGRYHRLFACRNPPGAGAGGSTLSDTLHLWYLMPTFRQSILIRCLNLDGGNVPKPTIIVTVRRSVLCLSSVGIFIGTLREKTWKNSHVAVSISTSAKF